MAAEPIVATHSDELCQGCGKRVLAGEAIVFHCGEWLHEQGSCVDLFDEKLEAAGKVQLRTAFGGTKVIARALLDDRTREQIDAGKLADGSSDPRGYVVTCVCGMQWWGTPDNLPIRQPDKHFEWCESKGEADRGRAA